MNRAIPAAMLTILFTGCWCASRPDPQESTARNPGRFRLEPGRLVTDMASRTARAPGADLRVLILSGGAQHGAFGTGILRQWRPGQAHFDLVTGISTGALQATAAFLGTEAQLAELERAYTTVEEDDLIDHRFWLSLPFSNSLATTGGLRNKIATTFTDAVIDTVKDHAAAHGGRLVVGTTDLDAGTFVIWDLTAMAAAGEYDLYRTVVLASASMPVFMEPVMIDGHIHVDGGVREQLFVRDLRDGLSRMRAGPTPCPVLDATVIVNGSVCAKPEWVENCLVPIALRTLDLILTEVAIGNLYKTQAILAQMARDRQATFRLASIPYDFVPGEHPGPKNMFDKAYMNALFQRGKKYADQNEWSQELIPTCPGGGQ